MPDSRETEKSMIVEEIVEGIDGETWEEELGTWAGLLEEEEEDD